MLESFFSWVRNGVKQAVLGGFRDAFAEIGQSVPRDAQGQVDGIPDPTHARLLFVDEQGPAEARDARPVKGGRK